MSKYSATIGLFLGLFASRLELKLSSLFADILYDCHRLIFMLFLRIYLHQLLGHFLKGFRDIVTRLGTHFQILYSFSFA
jgi:hypothetical protein